ncbi:MAG: twin-arginine translocase TatA/TatE family subunit [Actinomycetota bacterium]
MFFNMGGAEILVIALVALIAIGPEQLPSVMRKVGGFVGQARSITSGLRDEFMSGMDEIKDVADVEKWTGSGSDDDPIVPRGYADTAGETEADGENASTASERRGGQLGKADIPPPFSPSPSAARSKSTATAGSTDAGASDNGTSGNGTSEKSTGTDARADTGSADAEAAAGVETPADGEES